MTIEAKVITTKEISESVMEIKKSGKKIMAGYLDRKTLTRCANAFGLELLAYTPEPGFGGDFAEEVCILWIAGIGFMPFPKQYDTGVPRMLLLTS